MGALVDRREWLLQPARACRCRPRRGHTGCAGHPRRACSKYLFGMTELDRGGHGGFMKFSHLPLAQYGTKLVGMFRKHRSDVLSTPAACKISAVEGGVFTVLVCDIAQLGPLKSECLQAAKQVMANIDVSCMVVCYPEIASGWLRGTSEIICS